MTSGTEERPSLLSEFERCGNNELERRIEEKLGWKTGASIPTEIFHCLNFLQERFISKRKPLNYKRFEIGPGGSKTDRKRFVELLLRDEGVVELKEDETPTIEINPELLDWHYQNLPTAKKVYSCGKGIYLSVISQKKSSDVPDIIGVFLIKAHSVAGKTWQIS